MARRFRFRLEVVRKLRERARDAQRRVVADALRDVGRVEERITLLTEQLRETIAGSRDVHRQERLDVVSLRGHQFYRGWLHRRIMESNLDLAERKTKLDAERAKLGDLSKRLKVIENLRDRQWSRHRADVAREEQAAADEAALQMHLRQGHTGHEARA